MADRVAKGMVFGVFDGLHEGHKYFLTDAASRSEILVVVVAQDAAVQRIKEKSPKRTLAERIEAIRAFDSRLTVVPGDEGEGEWKIVTLHKPDLAFLGYDQQLLVPEIEKLAIAYTFLDAHQPEVFKSGLLDF
jgi:cytidyltransferase-like protein